MIRTVLRLAAVAALQNGGVEPWPTIAGDNVFDSRADAFDNMQPEDRQPVIVVRSLDDRISEVAPYNRLEQGSRMIELRIAYGVMAAYQAPDTDPPTVITDWPAVDAALEATLDLMEWQIKSALWGFGDWALWFKALPATYAMQIDSVPNFASPEDGRVRLALREMVISFRAPHDCLPKPVRQGDLPLDSSGHPVSPVPALPDTLIAVFDRIDALGGGDLKTAAAQIRASLEARNLPAASVKPMLTRIAATLPFGPVDSEGRQSSYAAELLGGS